MANAKDKNDAKPEVANKDAAGAADQLKQIAETTAKLEEREQALGKRSEELDGREAVIENGTKDLERRTGELDKREKALDDRQKLLDDRAAELQALAARLDALESAQAPRGDVEPGSVQITAKKEGFRRAGMSHPSSPVMHPPGTFTKQQIEVLRDEPNLVVQEF